MSSWKSKLLSGWAGSLWRRVALDIVAIGSRCVGLGLDLRWFPGGAQATGAEVATIFDVVILGERRDHRGAAGDLTDAIQDDLRAAIIEFDGSVNFDGATLQAPDVADIFQSGREDHHGEGAGHLVFAEVEEMDALISNSYFEDFAGNARGFTHVLDRLLYGDAIGGAE